MGVFWLGFDKGGIVRVGIVKDPSSIPAEALVFASETKST